MYTEREIWQNWCFGQFYHKSMQVFQNYSAFFLSVFLARENLKGLRPLFHRKSSPIFQRGLEFQFQFNDEQIHSQKEVEITREKF